MGLGICKWDVLDTLYLGEEVGIGSAGGKSEIRGLSIPSDALSRRAERVSSVTHRRLLTHRTPRVRRKGVVADTQISTNHHRGRVCGVPADRSIHSLMVRGPSRETEAFRGTMCSGAMLYSY